MKDQYWGKYLDKDRPEIHYDPLESFIDDNKSIIGFHVHIIKSRGDRPRDFIRTQSKPFLDERDNVVDPKIIKDSIFHKITNSNELAIVLATDKKTLMEPHDEPKLMDLNGENGVAIINKYSPLNLNHFDAGGIAIVAYSNKYSESLADSQPIYDILKSMKVAASKFIGNIDKTNKYGNLNASLIFFNVGPRSGASIRQLHGQMYLIPELTGLLTFAFSKAFQQSLSLLTTCLTCKLANSNEIVHDHLQQTIPLPDLIVWEDKNVRLIVPFAPIRFICVRILLKSHVSWIGKLNDEILESLSKAISYGHLLILNSFPNSFTLIRDRTVVFRQSSTIDSNFHMLVDILPCFLLGGSEVVDSLSISSINPVELAQKMKTKIDDIVNNTRNIYH